MLETRIQGIPCIVEMTSYFRLAPQGRSADSSDDCYGGHEIEFTVCDRRGRPAPWLERKMTDADYDRIEDELIAMQGDYDDQ